MKFNPMYFDSPEEQARAQAGLESEFGMPKTAHPDTEVGRMVNRIHHDRQAAMNDEFGWHGTTRADLRKRWNLPD